MSAQQTEVARREEFELTEAEYAALLEACRPVPYIAAHCGPIRSPQESANEAWVTLGQQRGFDGMSVRPVPGKGPRFITAEVRS